MEKSVRPYSLYFIILGFLLLFAGVNVFVSTYMVKDIEDKILKESQETIIKLFKENIRYYLARGQFREAYNKCVQMPQKEFIDRVQIILTDGEKICDAGNKENEQFRPAKIYFDQEEKEEMATLKIALNYNFYNREIFKFTLIIILTSLLILFIFNLQVRKLLAIIFDPFKKGAWRQGDTLIDKEGFLSGHRVLLNFSETSTLYRLLENFIEEINAKQKEMLTLSESKARYELSREIAHDMRSPLLALKGFLQSFQVKEKEEKVLTSAIERIQTIATKLLSEKSSHNVMTTYLLIPLLMEICEEKKWQYKEDEAIEIAFKWTIPFLEAVVCVDKIELKRVVSNLIDNAINAAQGKIRVELSVYGDHSDIIFRVVDNGRGIPRKIMKDLFVRGFSYGEKRGSGLGLYHSKKVIEASSGRIEIRSEEQEGTQVTVYLPRQRSCFVSTRYPLRVKNLWVADNSLQDREMIAGFLRPLVDQGCCIHSFSSLEELAQEIAGQKDISGVRFFIDNNFSDSQKDVMRQQGIEFILRHNLQEQAFLVTNDYDDPELIEKLNHSGVVMIPKIIFEYPREFKIIPKG